MTNNIINESVDESDDPTHYFYTISRKASLCISHLTDGKHKCKWEEGGMQLWNALKVLLALWLSLL